MKYNTKLTKQHLKKIIQNHLIEGFPTTKSQAECSQRYHVNKKSNTLDSNLEHVSIIQNLLLKSPGAKYVFCNAQ